MERGQRGEAARPHHEMQNADEEGENAEGEVKDSNNLN
jgi:hypothetical protein